MKNSYEEKKSYEEMTVSLVGVISDVVNKSGTYCDTSSNWTIKTFDAGGGNDCQ